MNKVRNTFLALVATLMAPMAANADLITNLDLTFRSGAVFDGVVVFDRDTYAMLDVRGKLTGGGHGDIYFDWTWNEGIGNPNPLDWDGNALTLEDWLMDGSPSNWNYFLGLSWFVRDGIPRLNLRTDVLYRSLNDGMDRIHNGQFTVPEPGTLALFGLGLLGIGAAKRRKVAA